MSDDNSEESAIETLEGSDADIEAAIDEAVQAVEESARKRAAGDASDAGEPDGDAPDGAPGNEVERLKAEVARLRDRSLRTLADFDNYRKRVERERSEDRKYGTQDLLREVVGIVDNLERASLAEGSLEDLRQGVELILRQLEDLLKRSGVARVEAVGEQFDPSVHEAVSRVEDPEVSEATVVEEFQAGYLVHDRLLRPSIVRVAVPASEGSDSDPSEEAAG